MAWALVNKAREDSLIMVDPYLTSQAVDTLLCISRLGEGLDHKLEVVISTISCPCQGLTLQTLLLTYYSGKRPCQVKGFHHLPACMDQSIIFNSSLDLSQ